VVAACIGAWLVGGEGFAVDVSLIEAHANKSLSIPGSDWNKEFDPERASRAANEYLATLEDAAYGAATMVVLKFVSPSDPAAQWTSAMKSAAFFAYADNYLIDVKFGIIMDVEASRAIRQAEVGASRDHDRADSGLLRDQAGMAGWRHYGSPPWEAWAMAIGIYLGLVGLELAQLSAASEAVRREIARPRDRTVHPPGDHWQPGRQRRMNAFVFAAPAPGLHGRAGRCAAAADQEIPNDQALPRASAI
jgi:hypothetical protein